MVAAATRGQFTGYVMDQNEEEVTAKVGKPDVVDNASPNIVKWTYKSKTFDPDNNNQSDDADGAHYEHSFPANR